MAARHHHLIAVVLTFAVVLPLLSLLFSIPDSARASRERTPQSLELAPVTSLRANFVSTVNKFRCGCVKSDGLPQPACTAHAIIW